MQYVEPDKQTKLAYFIVDLPCIHPVADGL